MLESEIIKSQDNNGRENKEIGNSCNLKSEHDIITGSVSDKKFVYLKHQVELPGTFYTFVSHGRKNFRHQINRSLNFGINPSRRGNLSRLSPNSSMDHSRSSINKSSRNLTRSAQMMRALSKNHASFRYANESIKKTLTFDSSPSPKKNNSSEESTSVDSIVNTPLHTPDKSLEHDRNSTDSASTSSVPTDSFESIDENQNRTPQQNRIVSKMIGSSDTKRSSNKSGSPGSTSMLRSNLRERIDSIISRNMRTRELQCFKRGDRLRASSCDIAASTPRNLFKEFNEDEEGSPHTPENLRFIPGNMSSIKKSHKKERSHSLGGKVWQVNDPIKSKSLCAKRPMESLEADDIPTSSSSCMITVKDSPKKIRNVKKTLIYDLDDELSDKESISDHVEQGIAPNNIYSSDCEMWGENIQDIDDVLPSTSSTLNHNNKENNSYLQKASSSNVDLAEHENKEISLASNSAVSEISMHDRLMHYLDSISTPVMRKLDKNCYELQDKSCQTWEKRFEAVTAEPIRNVRMSDVQDTTEKINRTQNNDMINPKSERPITPENLNSSRLLLSQFTSVKKSHKEDKRKYKSLFGVPICDIEDKETFRKVVNLLADDLLTEMNSNKSRNALFPTRLSPDKSKKKRFMSRSLQSNKHDDLPQLAEPLATGCENIDDESNTYIRNRVSSILLSFKNYIRRGEELSGKFSDNEPAKATDATDENGRLTPTNMSTAELLCNKDSIKKSHKKDKHDASLCKRRIPRKNLSEDSKETADMNFSDCTKTSGNHTTPSLKLDPHDDSLCDEIGACSSMRNEDNKKSDENNIYDPQPSTSRGIIESKEDTKKLKPLSTTPPNSLNTLKLMRLLHTTSIKKSHKKERHLKKQSKYILMNKEHDLSDDGSIFDEDDILTSGESFGLFENNKN